MLNEEKVRYMTELAIFEKNEGRKIFPVNRFFKSDYVGGQMFRSFFGYTFSFLLIVLTWAMYRLDVILGGAGPDTVLSWIKNGTFAYVGGLVLYLAVTWKISSRRYEIAARSQKMFTARLKHLIRRYGKDQPDTGRENRGGRAI